MTYFQRLVVNILTLISLSVVSPGVIYVGGIMPAIIAAFVLSTLNMLVRPVLTTSSLPFTLLAFGPFSFIVNAAILQMTLFFAGETNFGFSSFRATVLMTVTMSIVNMVITDHNLPKYE